MPVRPMLGDVELQQVQKIEVDEDQVLVQHSIPALEGDFFQLPGRRATKVALTGVLTGSEVDKGLATWREKFRAAQPLPFVADITTSTKVNQVVIEELGVRELAGKPERFEYALTLREYIPPPKVEREAPPPPPPIPPPPPVDKGTLIVEVMMAGQPDFDYNTVNVTVEGTQQDGTPLTRTLKNQSPTWTEENMPPGQYTVKVMGPEPQALTKTTEATVRSGEQTKVTLTLDPAAPPSNIAKTFIVHFRMDNAFVEPAMREVLGRVAQYAEEHPTEKLIVLGHTDLVGSGEYNQNLSERRARSVYAYLTYGRDEEAQKEAVQEWNLLRQAAGQWQRDITDNWGTREYQFMLQDLYKYYGNIDGIHGPKTAAAVSKFQEENELPPTGVMDDPTWEKLIEAYLGQEPLTIPEKQLFRNARNGCEGGILKWLGAGEQDPVKNTQDAWRPNRRTELLFVQGDQIPGDVPKPRTFDKLNPGGSWCLGPDLNQQPEARIKRVNFLSRQVAEPGKWWVQPAEPGQIVVNGTITKDTDDGPPVPYAKYVLIAPDGTYLHTDPDGNPDLGERPQGEQKGQPIPNRADENGAFSYPEPTPEGNYTLEILDVEDDPAVARWKGENNREATGTIIFNQISAKQVAGGEALAPQKSLPRVGGVLRPTGPVAILEIHIGPKLLAQFLKDLIIAVDGKPGDQVTILRATDSTIITYVPAHPVAGDVVRLQIGARSSMDTVHAETLDQYFVLQDQKGKLIWVACSALTNTTPWLHPRVSPISANAAKSLFQVDYRFIEVGTVPVTDPDWQQVLRAEYEPTANNASAQTEHPSYPNDVVAEVRDEYRSPADRKSVNHYGCSLHLIEDNSGSNPINWFVVVPKLLRYRNTCPLFFNKVIDTQGVVSSTFDALVFFRPVIYDTYSRTADLKKPKVLKAHLARYVLEPPTDAPFFAAPGYNPQNINGSATSSHWVWAPFAGFEQQLKKSGKRLLLVYPFPNGGIYGAAIEANLRGLLESLIAALLSSKAIEVPAVPTPHTGRIPRLNRLAISGFSYGSARALDAWVGNKSGVDEVYLSDASEEAKQKYLYNPTMVSALLTWLKTPTTNNKTRKLRLSGGEEFDAFQQLKIALETDPQIKNSGQVSLFPATKLFFNDPDPTHFYAQAMQLAQPIQRLDQYPVNIQPGTLSKTTDLYVNSQSSNVDNTILVRSTGKQTPVHWTASNTEISSFIRTEWLGRGNATQAQDDLIKLQNRIRAEFNNGGLSNFVRHQWALIAGDGDPQRASNFEGFLFKCLRDSNFEP